MRCTRWAELEKVCLSGGYIVVQVIAEMKGTGGRRVEEASKIVDGDGFQQCLVIEGAMCGGVTAPGRDDLLPVGALEPINVATVLVIAEILHETAVPQ